MAKQRDRDETELRKNQLELPFGTSAPQKPSCVDEADGGAERQSNSSPSSSEKAATRD